EPGVASNAEKQLQQKPDTDAVCLHSSLVEDTKDKNKEDSLEQPSCALEVDVPPPRSKRLYRLKDNISAEDGATLPCDARIVYDDADVCVLFKPRGVETTKFKHWEDLMLVGRPWLWTKEIPGDSVDGQEEKEGQEEQGDAQNRAKKNLKNPSPQSSPPLGPHFYIPPKNMPFSLPEQSRGSTWEVEDRCDKVAAANVDAKRRFDLQPLSAPEPVHRLDKDTGGLV
ncbi:unnamed protein product, partial [Amoebophrya sp. A25]